MVGEDFTILDQVPPVVAINVGGQVFVTSRDTLLRVPESLICRMFQGEVPVKKVQQTDVTYFVDRDPKHFQRILNYMRDGSCVLPQSVEDREELLAEARYYEMPALEKVVRTSLAETLVSNLKLDFRSLVLRHHAETGSLASCVEVVLGFIRDALVKITPVTEVNSENRLQVFWLSASLPPANPTRIAFRYRGDREANDVGVTVSEKDEAFMHWSRLWDIYNNNQLLTTFKELMRRCGLKVQLVGRVETFKQDSQLDVVWKMYRVRSLVVSITAV